MQLTAARSCPPGADHGAELQTPTYILHTSCSRHTHASTFVYMNDQLMINEGMKEAQKLHIFGFNCRYEYEYT